MDNTAVMINKMFYCLILLCFALCSCQDPDALEINEPGGPVGKIMLTSETPFDGTIAQLNYYLINVGSEGGTFTVIASFPENEGVALNDRFTVAWSDMVPEHLVDISRTKLDAYHSSYEVKVKPNSFGKSYECYIEMLDESRVDKSGKPLTSRATLIIRQQ